VGVIQRELRYLRRESSASSQFRYRFPYTRNKIQGRNVSCFMSRSILIFDRGTHILGDSCYAIQICLLISCPPHPRRTPVVLYISTRTSIDLSLSSTGEDSLRRRSRERGAYTPPPSRGRRRHMKSAPSAALYVQQPLQ
jgi:hypothetical protein